MGSACLHVSQAMARTADDDNASLLVLVRFSTSEKSMRRESSISI